MTGSLTHSFRFDLRLRAATFATATVIVYAVALSITRNLGAYGADAALIAWGVTLDIALVVPVLYGLLLVRGGAPRLSLVPVTLLSFAAAGAVVPREYHQALGALEAAVLPLEVGLVGFLIWQVRRAIGGSKEEADPVARLQVVSARLFGPGLASKIFAFETSIFYFAVATWRQAVPAVRPGEVRVTHDQKALYSTFFWGVMIAGVVEVSAVHFLVARWSAVAAWVLSALSIYGLVWLIGDYRAVRLRPSSIRDCVFSLNLGLRWKLDVPVGTVKAVRKVTAPEQELLRKDKSVLRAVLLGEPTHLMTLDEPIVAHGPYGIRRHVDRIALTVDDPAAFEAALA